MDISNITYGGIDVLGVAGSRFIEDLLVNKIIRLDGDVDCIYKISTEVKSIFAGDKDILSGVNADNVMFNGSLSEFTLKIKILIEYTNSDKLLGVKKFEFIETRFIPIPFIVDKSEIKGKVRNVYISKNSENEIYLSLYYVLII